MSIASFGKVIEFQVLLMLLGVPPLRGLQSQYVGENDDFQALCANISRKR